MRLRAWILFAGACTAPTVTPPPPSEPAPVPKVVEVKEEPVVEPPQPDVAAPVPGKQTLLKIEAEWDGKAGPDEIALYDDGRVTAGAEEGRATLPTTGGYFFGEQAKIEVVKLGHAKFERAIVLGIPTDAEEDPPNVYQVFVSDGGALRKVWEQEVGSYGVVPLEFAGDGTVRYLEDGWTACERAKFPTEVKLKTVVLKVGADGMLAEVKRTATKQTQKCGELAACPFVYVVGDGGAVRQGEILRNLRSHGVQTLALPVPREEVLRVRVTEEKPEVTRLDAIAIVVDGVEVRPRACELDGAIAYCEEDRVYEVLQRGDALELEFDVPRRADSIELRAAGFYTVLR